ncbi:hypothetical protein [Paracoccus liaowanqingii]|nr:hypothetical protein [Paracoccus liaowanqingii]
MGLMLDPLADGGRVAPAPAAFSTGSTPLARTTRLAMLSTQGSSGRSGQI